MEGKIEEPKQGEEPKQLPITVLVKQDIELTQPDGGNQEKTLNLDALKDKIAKAKEIKQGNKSDDAFEALQEAISTAEKVTDEEALLQKML